MPIKLTTLDEKMSIRIESDTKDQIIALSWVWGLEGNYGNAVRHILRSLLPDIVNKLKENDLENYEKTLEYVTQQRILTSAAIMATPDLIFEDAPAEVPDENQTTDKENQNE